MSMNRRAMSSLFAAMMVVVAVSPSMAQLAHHPFAVGANEGAVGHQTGLGAWIIGQESRFYLALTGAVGAAATGWTGAVPLIALSFAYGVFHAAGPGHGKAVITSYMVSNEVALRRGFLIALCAALFQAVIATALVGIAAWVFNATAPRMTATAQAIELASYIGIVILGVFLVWRKTRALFALWRPVPASAPLVLAGAGFDTPLAVPTTSRFVASAGADHVHDDDCDCGHAHMPLAELVGGDQFDWKAAAAAIVTAGARPCSGAILVLVFALSQGIFIAGVASAFAMSLGTALTTGLLATSAVLAKDFAMRLAGPSSFRARVVARVAEVGAAFAVLLFGLALLGATLAGVHGGG